MCEIESITVEKASCDDKCYIVTVKTNNDIYKTALEETEFNSILLDWDMLETALNCGLKGQCVDDIQCVTSCKIDSDKCEMLISLNLKMEKKRMKPIIENHEFIIPEFHTFLPNLTNLEYDPLDINPLPSDSSPSFNAIINDFTSFSPNDDITISPTTTYTIDKYKNLDQPILYPNGDILEYIISVSQYLSKGDSPNVIKLTNILTNEDILVLHDGQFDSRGSNISTHETLKRYYKNVYTFNKPKCDFLINTFESDYKELFIDHALNIDVYTDFIIYLYNYLGLDVNFDLLYPPNYKKLVNHIVKSLIVNTNTSKNVINYLDVKKTISNIYTNGKQRHDYNTCLDKSCIHVLAACYTKNRVKAINYDYKLSLYINPDQNYQSKYIVFSDTRDLLSRRNKDKSYVMVENNHDFVIVKEI